MSDNQSQPPQRGFLPSEVNDDLLNIPTITIHKSFSNPSQRPRAIDNDSSNQSLIPSTVPDAAFSDDEEDTVNSKYSRKRSRLDYSTETPLQKRKREERNEKQRERRKAKKRKEEMLEKKCVEVEAEKECYRRKLEYLLPLPSYNNKPQNGSQGNADFDCLTKMDLDQLLTQEPEECDMPILPPH